MSIVGSLLCACIAGIGLGSSYRTYRLAEASRRWPKVQGTINELRHDESLPLDEGPETVTFSSHMTFTYRVAGRAYRSTRFTFRPTRGLGQQAAYAMLRGLRRGQPVDVHYDPKAPSRAVVLPGSDSGNRQILASWGVLFAAAILWLLASLAIAAGLV
jgi:hypothetical protein